MAAWKYVVGALCGAGLVGGSAAGERVRSRASVPDHASERFSDLEPMLLPASVPSTGPTGGGEFLFAAIVDTLGRIETESVQTLIAKDSAGAQTVRRQLRGVRYVPGQVVEAVDSCVHINRVVRHCGGASPRVRLVRRRVLLHLEFEPAAPR